MAGIDGEWQSVAQSPMGEQKSLLKLSSQPDGSFSGTSTGAAGDAPVSGGTLEGDQVTFKIAVSKPFPLTLTVNGTLSGDTIDGQIDTGAFGKYPMKATRQG